MQADVEHKLRSDNDRYRAQIKELQKEIGYFLQIIVGKENPSQFGRAEADSTPIYLQSKPTNNTFFGHCYAQSSNTNTSEITGRSPAIGSGESLFSSSSLSYQPNNPFVDRQTEHTRSIRKNKTVVNAFQESQINIENLSDADEVKNFRSQNHTDSFSGSSRPETADTSEMKAIKAEMAASISRNSSHSSALTTSSAEIGRRELNETIELASISCLRISYCEQKEWRVDSAATDSTISDSHLNLKDDVISIRSSGYVTSETPTSGSLNTVV